MNSSPGKRWPHLTLIEWLLIVAVIAVGLGLVLPLASRLPREYYDGHDQLYWFHQLEDNDAMTRHQAVLALCQMLKQSRSPYIRQTIVEALRARGPEAKDAVPTLIELLHDDDAGLQTLVEDAIKKIDPVAYERLRGEENRKENRKDCHTGIGKTLNYARRTRRS